MGDGGVVADLNPIFYSFVGEYSDTVVAPTDFSSGTIRLAIGVGGDVGSLQNL